MRPGRHGTGSGALGIGVTTIGRPADDCHASIRKGSGEVRTRRHRGLPGHGLQGRRAGPGPRRALRGGLCGGPRDSETWRRGLAAITGHRRLEWMRHGAQRDQGEPRDRGPDHRAGADVDGQVAQSTVARLDCADRGNLEPAGPPHRRRRRDDGWPPRARAGRGQRGTPSLPYSVDPDRHRAPDWPHCRGSAGRRRDAAERSQLAITNTEDQPDPRREAGVLLSPGGPEE